MSKKKSKADVEKVVSAQARRKAVGGAVKGSKARKGELDSRASKSFTWKQGS